MKLSKAMTEKMYFANFCIIHTLKPYDVACLVTLAHKAYNAGERAANSGDAKASNAEGRAASEFESKAKELGFGTEWYGLWPSLKKDGKDVNLPV